MIDLISTYFNHKFVITSGKGGVLVVGVEVVLVVPVEAKA